MKNKKGLIIGLGIFLVILLGVVVVYLVLMPAPEIKPTSTPMPQNTPQPSSEAEVPEVNLIDGSNVCQLDFVVKPAPSSEPVVSCTSLTKNKTDSQIKIGTKITFTCTGVSLHRDYAGTPADGDNTVVTTDPGEQDITYDYRVSKDGGAWEDMVTTFTSLLPNGIAYFTPETAGSYIVQCRACLMTKNAEICDPIWVETRPD